MTLALGVDTGGTYTDAVLIKDEKTIIATAKSLTTRNDLAIGIERAVRAVLKKAQVSAAEVTLASLSTTLATNALVEGQGGRVGLVYIGFNPRDLENHDLSQALRGDPHVILNGGHDHAGAQVAPLDTVTLKEWLSQAHGISAFAVAAQFATRNPAHENEAQALITHITGRPTSLSHHLSAKLNGPKRALTALLNARLIALTHRLIGRAQDILKQIGVTAPLMVVRGDGALMSAKVAQERPIETILSGPAASIVGARWLTGADHALVSDIGGTTTDIAVLRGGKPAIDPRGARVGQFRTMVEAVAMRTTGLGGDSEVHFISSGLQGGVTLGPRRVLPLALIAHEAPQMVLPVLERQLRKPLPGDYDGRFVRRIEGMEADGLPPRDQDVLRRILTQVQPLEDVLTRRLDTEALGRLIARGLVQIAALTPSDASHMLGRMTIWNKEAAQMGLRLFMRRRTGAGDVLCTDPSQMAQMIIDQMTQQTGNALLEAAFADLEQDFDAPPDVLARHSIIKKGLVGYHDLIKLSAGLGVDVVALGASAASYYPAVGDHLNCPILLPKHKEVANAIGAVVGRVTVRKQGHVTSPSEGRYRIHLQDGPQDVPSAQVAMDQLEIALRAEAETSAKASGAQDIQISVKRDIKQARLEGRNVFVEGTIYIEASGRPRVAES